MVGSEDLHQRIGKLHLKQNVVQRRVEAPVSRVGDGLVPLPQGHGREPQSEGKVDVQHDEVPDRIESIRPGGIVDDLAHVDSKDEPKHHKAVEPQESRPKVSWMGRQHSLEPCGLKVCPLGLPVSSPGEEDPEEEDAKVKDAVENVNALQWDPKRIARGSDPSAWASAGGKSAVSNEA